MMEATENGAEDGGESTENEEEEERSEDREISMERTISVEVNDLWRWRCYIEVYN